MAFSAVRPSRLCAEPARLAAAQVPRSSERGSNRRKAMKKLALTLALGATALLPSCFAGPHQLCRTVDDWDQKTYISSPWLSAALWVIPVFPLAKFGAGITDFLVGDAYAFWFKDAWDGKGTGYEHFAQTWTDGRMKSLLSSDSGFMRIDSGAAMKK